MAHTSVGEIIQDEEVFDDSYDDVELLYRKTEIKQLRKLFRSGNGILVTGSSGVGKSLFTQKAIDELPGVGITAVRVNCFGKTGTAIKRELLESHPNGPDEIGQTTSEATIDQHLEAAIDGETVFILDEGGQIHQTDVIGQLSRFSDVTLIAIAHDENEWMAAHKVEYGSSIPFEHLPLHSFTTDELAHILERRAIQAFFNRSVVTAQQLRQIADDVHGVARNGIQRLWAAGTFAAERGHYKITDQDIADGEERAMTRIRHMNLTSLPFHHRVLYAIVHEAGEITGDELHQRYEQVAEDLYHGQPAESIGERARLEKFPKLEQYDLVRRKGKTKDRVYRVIDPDVEPVKIDLEEPAVVQ